MIIKCYHCGNDIQMERKVGRQDTCSECGTCLHCCRNCRFFAPDVYHKCIESQAEWVNDKESANFCDYFEPGVSSEPLGKSGADEAREKLNQLFKKR
ncbi:hypothetical protein KA005_16105 [bacterium]|nr:hypothetical protein [bacterium]